jgi:hypothetical protein
VKAPGAPMTRDEARRALFDTVTAYGGAHLVRSGSTAAVVVEKAIDAFERAAVSEAVAPILTALDKFSEGRASFVEIFEGVKKASGT